MFPMNDPNALSLPDLYTALHADGLISRLLQIAREEDLGAGTDGGDVTGHCFVPGYVRTTAHIVSREPATISGLACCKEILHAFECDADVHLTAADGDTVAAGTQLATITGRLRDILVAERTLLNMIGRLSGIATLTARYVQAAKSAPGSRAAVLDTRKTTPGLRHLEKYAVRCGGGRCHRLGLYDAVLIKDNHIAGLDAGIRADLGVTPDQFKLNLAQEVKRAVKSARDNAPKAGLRFIELEVDRLDQLEAILAAEGGTACGVQIILLDNMPPDQLRLAVSMRDTSGVRVLLEASGGVNLETIAGIATTGIDRISVGGLTHQATSVDVGLDIA